MGHFYYSCVVLLTSVTAPSDRCVVKAACGGYVGNDGQQLARNSGNFYSLNLKVRYTWIVKALILLETRPGHPVSVHVVKHTCRWCREAGV
ncbi:hypothetical protein XENOCAPTIV_019537 [Xenoophorus captivus]|uniref:Secreted protein n=1 Tax=Xenoophorus captivus TaxID=1517983 RepID=A0ABV0QX49_9TELE